MSCLSNPGTLGVAVKFSCNSILFQFPYVQEFWDHAAHFLWRRSAVWDHVWFLSNRLLTTKQSMEDLIGTIADHTARDQKAQLSGARLLSSLQFQEVDNSQPVQVSDFAKR